MPKERTREEEEAFEEFRRSRYPDERSRGIAERAFAEKKGEVLTKDQLARAKAATEMGSPTLWGPKEGGLPKMATFTDPQGYSKTFDNEGRMIYEGHVVINDQLYSPYDQRQLHKLYQSRSQAATDPAMTEDDRQRALDIFDEQISRVPQLAPSRREPTAQQKFEASIVTAPDGTQYTIGKDGQPKVLEQNKAEADRRAAYNETLGKGLAGAMKINEGREGADVRLFDDMLKEQILLAGIQHGFDLQPDFAKVTNTPVAPKLTPAWGTAMFNLDRANAPRESIADKIAGVVAPQKRATEQQMRAEMEKFIIEGVKKGMSDSVASVDFLSRWKEEAGQDTLGLVPKFPQALEQKLSLGKLLTANPNITSPQRQGSDASGGGQAQQPTVQPLVMVGPDKVSIMRSDSKIKSYPSSKEFLVMWNALDTDSKQEAQEALLRGFTPQQLLDAYNKQRAK